MAARAQNIEQKSPTPVAVPPSGASPYTLALRAELAGGLKRLGTFSIGDDPAEVSLGADSIWVVVRRPRRGGVAIRAAYVPGGFRAIKTVAAERNDGALRLEAKSAIGRHRFTFEGSGVDLRRLKVRVWLTPEQPLVLPFLPRDLYPLDANDDPLGARGHVEAAQRGPNTGLVYLAIDEPAFGHVLYVQDLSSLQAYYKATCTAPMGAVGGEWPELGYLPTTPQSGTPPVHPLQADEEVQISDAIVVLRDGTADSEQEKARQFVQMLADAYTAMRLPPVIYRDWVARAEKTLQDLDRASSATCDAYGHRYIRPYTDAEYPDSMVQMTVIASLHEYARWTGKPVPLADQFAAGMQKFYDPELQTLRRYLPNVGDDKDADAVDSWYLYHPLRNLAQMALHGEEWARDLFLRSVDFGIRAAHHFQYKWPIQYNVRDFSIITAKRNDDTFGQTDVGGFYAYVMLLGFELTGETRFLDEATAAIDAAQGMRFELEYQANLTAWGAAACMRLWRVTNQDRYRNQVYVYLATLFHNCEIWESEIKAAEHYSNFLGATALQDAPYMALYECFDSFAALERLLLDSGPTLEPSAKMLVSEYCKYVLHRAWFYYPDALPKEILAAEQRNGFIDRRLSFPLEDLYADGQPPGQVGQEIYGAGAPFVLASRAFHRVEGESFDLYCNHFIVATDRTAERGISLQLVGGETCQALLAVVRRGRAALPECKLVLADGDAVRSAHKAADRIEFHVPADGRVVLTWSRA